MTKDIDAHDLIPMFDERIKIKGFYGICGIFCTFVKQKWRLQLTIYIYNLKSIGIRYIPNLVLITYQKLIICVINKNTSQ